MKDVLEKGSTNLDVLGMQWSERRIVKGTSNVRDVLGMH